MVTKTINSTRLDLYHKYVDEDAGEYPFNHRYELFSLAVVLGYLDGSPHQPSADDAGYSQDFIKVSDIQNEKHTAAINFIYNLVALELVSDEEVDLKNDQEEFEQVAWTRTKEYADRGLEILDNELSVQGEIDLIRLVNEAEGDWPNRTNHVKAIFDT